MKKEIKECCEKCHSISRWDKNNPFACVMENCSCHNQAEREEKARQEMRQILLDMIDDMRKKQYEDKTILESIYLNLKFSKFIKIKEKRK